MITAADLQTQIISWTAQHSGHDAHRRYVGLSGAGDCPVVIYRRYLAGTPATDKQKLKTAISYELERAIIERLKRLGTYRPGVEITAYGGLVRGHTDGMMPDGRLLEIKTLEREEFFPEAGRLPRRIFYQVNAYMFYGKFPEQALVIFLARDTGAVRVLPCFRIEAVCREIDRKIRSVVASIDLGDPPACSCGRCCLAPAVNEERSLG